MNLLRWHRGVTPVQNPLARQIRISSPMRLNPLSHVYLAVEPDIEPD